jgi:phenylalanine-4-hydroxylase
MKINHNKGQLTIQNYKSYTKEDHKTWSTLFERQVENLKKDDKVVKIFWEGISKLKIKKGEIPDFQDLNKILKSLSNFEIVAVTGILDDNIFFQLIKNRKFPVTTWIRKQDQLDYIEQPDIFHDLFGHVPFLVDRQYCDFLVELAELATPYFQGTNKEMQYAFSRAYWYSIEFGVLQNKDLNRKQIYGAGIISSFSETNKVFEEGTLFRKLEPVLLSERFEKNHLQNFYGLADNEGMCNLAFALGTAMGCIKIVLDETNAKTEIIN